MNERIEYIDLAKGICILLVMSNHIDNGIMLHLSSKTEAFLYSFRMPLYFLLSGIFISFRKGYKDFFQKKINKLIIPFIFFCLITNLYCYILSLVAQSESLEIFRIDYSYVSPLYFAITENEVTFPLHNNAIWFLIALFNTYLCYALIHHLVSKNRNGQYIILAVSFILGFTGFYLGKCHINLPFYLDTSLTCLPFVCMGVTIRQKTNLLTFPGYKATSLTISFTCFLFAYVFSEGKSFFFSIPTKPTSYYYTAQV